MGVKVTRQDTVTWESTPLLVSAGPKNVSTNATKLSFFTYIKIFIYLSLAGLGLCCSRAFSSYGKQEPPFPLCVQASHCSGSSCRAHALEHVRSVAAVPGL